MARRQRSAPNVVWWALALLPPILGFALRLHYALQTEPFVDEPTTLLVAQAIARYGIPTLPSGLFYGNDLPFSYLAAILTMIFGPRLVVIRLFSMVLSVATIALLYQAGKWLISRWTGLWAALLLALSPAAIVWGGRARAYALLAFLVFLATWLYCAGLASQRPRSRRLGLLVLVVAVFVHPEAALLLPAFALGGLLLKGWRWWLNPGRLAELALTAAAIGARFWLHTVVAQGRIGSIGTIVGSRPPVELVTDWLFRLQRVSPYFLASDQLLWTILALLALVAAVVSALRRRCLGGRSQAIVFFSVCLWLVPLLMLLFLGNTYQSPRYLYMLLPSFALLAASGLDWLMSSLSRVGPLSRHPALLGGLATIVLLAIQWPAAIGASTSTEKGFHSALEYVDQQWEAGDRVATVAPAYSQTVLGRNDFFTLGVDYEEFVLRGEDGGWVDRWLGSPLIRSAEDLEAALDGAERLWFVTDESRFRKRFDQPFAQAVWQQMDLVAKADQVMVFLSRQADVPAVSHFPDTPLAIFQTHVELAGYDLGGPINEPPDAGWGQVIGQPGQVLPLTLYWRALGPVAAQYTVFVHLLGPDGQRVAQDDGPPLAGLQPMTHWLAGELLPDRRSLKLPAVLQPGQYRLEIGLYGQEDGDRLPIMDASGNPLGEALTFEYIRILSPGESMPSPDQAVQGELGGEGERIRLLGYELGEVQVTPGGELPLTLYWQALDPIEDDYTVFVHMLDAAGQIWGQGDGPPVGGFHPTSLWDKAEVIIDERKVAIEDGIAPGTYQLVTGLYLLSTGQRTEGTDGDHVLLGEVQVGP
ncbi:ArnT family glycosyltransferase [Chloroflexota bacterium]